MEPAFDSVCEAQKRLGGRVHRTPVHTSRSLDALAGVRVFLKCENFQRCGAFKARGALNAVFSLDEGAARRGVVTHSSGNHGTALALAARERGIPAHIVVPRGAVRTKVAAIERLGGRIAYCEPTMAARQARCAELLESTGGTLVHPFDDPLVIAGQGTAALELLQDVPGLDAILAPVGGGGLISGTALAAHGINPAIRVIGAEPAAADDAARSLESGRIVSNASTNTIADGLRGNLSPLTFSILRSHGVRIATVSEAEIAAAMRFVWEILKLVIEPSSAVAVAALLGRPSPVAAGARVGIILSGGNVDLDALPWIGR